MFVFLILLLMLTRLQCDNKTFGDDFDNLTWQRLNLRVKTLSGAKLCIFIGGS